MFDFSFLLTLMVLTAIDNGVATGAIIPDEGTPTSSASMEEISIWKKMTSTPNWTVTRPPCLECLRFYKQMSGISTQHLCFMHFDPSSQLHFIWEVSNRLSVLEDRTAKVLPSLEQLHRKISHWWHFQNVFFSKVSPKQRACFVLDLWHKNSDLFVILFWFSAFYFKHSFLLFIPSGVKK